MKPYQWLTIMSAKESLVKDVIMILHHLAALQPQEMRHALPKD